jgi:hypothetical protein
MACQGHGAGPTRSTVNVRFSPDILELPFPTIAKPTVVDVRGGADCLYIGRKMGTDRQASPWANMHKVDKDTPENRAAAVNAYIRSVLGTDQRVRLHTLRGLTLGCWCSPRLCHGHALAELVMQQKSHGLPCPHCTAPLQGWLNLWQDGSLYETAVCTRCHARGYWWRELPTFRADGTLALVAAMQ